MVTEDDVAPKKAHRLEEIIGYFRDEGLFATHAHICAPSIAKGTEMGISVLRGSVFRPNLLFINTNVRSQEETAALVECARRNHMGAALLILHDQTLLGREREINIWVRDQSPNWSLGLRLANLDLAILLGFQIRSNWDGRINLVSAIPQPHHVQPAKQFLEALIQDARLPTNTHLQVWEAEFAEALEKTKRADLNIFGLSHNVGLDRLRDLSAKTQSSCLFVLDSGEESALA
jgi:hypothetical protein